MSQISKEKLDQLDAQVLLFCRSYLDLIEQQTDLEVREAFSNMLQPFSQMYQIMRETRDANTLKKMAVVPKLVGYLSDLNKATETAQKLVNEQPHRVVALAQFDSLCRTNGAVLNQLIEQIKQD